MTQVAADRPLDISHKDYELIQRIEAEIISHAKGWQNFRVQFPNLVRQAIDEVIDAPRSKRFRIDELEKTEKTYLGTKIEILLRNYLDLERGKNLDVLIDGIEVDIKNTIGSTWTIPLEALGHPCILIISAENTAKCSFGIIVISPEVLNEGRNRDQKTTISKAGMKNIHWLLYDVQYPINIWETIGEKSLKKLLAIAGGTERLAQLFREFPETPFTRNQIEALAQQKDFMKRLRKNGGARDMLSKEGIALLSGQTHKDLISQLHLPQCKKDEFISYKPESELHINLLRRAHEIE